MKVNGGKKGAWGILRRRDRSSDGADTSTHDVTELTKANIIIGRHSQCDVVVKNKKVSGKHVMITKLTKRSGEVQAVVSLLSQRPHNLAYLNYKMIQRDKFFVLRHKDSISLDKKKVTFTFEEHRHASSSSRKRQASTSLKRQSSASMNTSEADKRPRYHHRSLPTGLIIKCDESHKGGKLWEVKDFIGQGTFSEIYKVVCKETSMKAAIKVEKLGTKHDMLPKELDILKELQSKATHVCSYLGSGKLPGKVEGSGLFICMELCSMNVSEYRKKQKDQKIPQYEGGKYAANMLRALQSVHELGYLHRDIKPSNFMLPFRPDKFACVIVDFGLCKRHIKDGKVEKPRSKVPLKGTSLYASLNAHREKELGRRDDLWSLLYVITDCINGGLPWRQCAIQKDRIGAFNKKLKYCGDGKIPGDDQLQRPLQNFMRHLHTLKYEDKPDYDYLVRCLEELAELGQKKKASP